MFLTSLSLENFRSFSQKKLVFSPGTTLILGPNASGKTNILEAIYLLAAGRSFRAAREEMIKNSQELARISSKINLLADRLALEIILTRGKVQAKKTPRKMFQVNGVGKRKKDFIGQLAVVLFRPEDINIVLGSPAVRRNYLDVCLQQADWQYRLCSLAYQKGIRQRNQLLRQIREGKGQKHQLIFWDNLLIKNGQVIWKKRAEFLDFINQKIKPRNIEVVYDQSFISTARLAKYQEAEIALGATLVGPHRDNLLKRKPATGRFCF